MKRLKSKKYNYFYKITNLLNGKFYYGVHATDNLDDGYLGSGGAIIRDRKKYGKEIFKKEILKYFSTIDEAYEEESKIVTEELVKDPMCYNLVTGGKHGLDMTGLVVVKDPDDLSKTISITKEEYDTGRYESVFKGKVIVKDKNDNILVVDITNPDYINGNFTSISKGKVTVKDRNGNTMSVNIDDPRYVNGELVPIWLGEKHKPEDILKAKETYKLIKHQQGTKNSQYGTNWIYKYENGIPINKKVKKEDLNLYLSSGWVCGKIPSQKELDALERGRNSTKKDKSN